MFFDLFYDEFYDEVGNFKEEYEKVYYYKNVIFWFFSCKDYKKINWWLKIVSLNVSDKIIICIVNMVRKIVGM